MYRFAGKLAVPCLVSAAIVALIAFYLGFFVAPVDVTQGNSYRILLYSTLPGAWMAVLLYVLMAIFLHPRFSY